MFEDKYFNYGVVKVDGHVVKVYYGLYDYRMIGGLCDEVAEAYWSGRSIIVKLKHDSNQYMRYYDFDKYEWVRY